MVKPKLGCADNVLNIFNIIDLINDKSSEEDDINKIDESCLLCYH